jgi:hypothetical protein
LGVVGNYQVVHLVARELHPRCPALARPLCGRDA